MYKFNLKITPRLPEYHNAYFNYMNKYYKIVKVDNENVYFTLPGTYKDGSLEKEGWVKGDQYRVSFMLREKFDKHISDKDYFLIDELDEVIPNRLREFKSE